MLCVLALLTMQVMGHIPELIELSLLTQRAWDVGIQVMIEGPGHMAINEIEANMQLEKRLCKGAPFMS